MPPKEITVNIAAESVGFKRIMYFNRFAIEPEGDGYLLHFGFVETRGLCHEVFSCWLSANDIKHNRDRLLPYLDKIETKEVQSMPNWMPPSDPRNIFVVRFINAARIGNTAEMLLYNFTLIQVAIPSEPIGQSRSIKADPIACLACELPMQLAFIKTLFAGEK